MARIGQTMVLGPADAAVVRGAIAAEFAGMTPGWQQELMRMRWKELCDAGLPVASEPMRSTCVSMRPEERGSGVP